MELRQYQLDAVAAVYDHLRNRDDNPCVVIPTGGGKTPVMAQIVKDTVLKWNGRVLILAHVRELLEQAIDKLRIIAPEMWNHVGVYSAGLNRRDTDSNVIVAGIQSVYKRATNLDKFDLILIDEAHMIPPDGEGMYRTFLNDTLCVNQKTRIVGLTATAFRTSSGSICTDTGILNSICYEISVRDLIDAKFLTMLKSKSGGFKPNDSQMRVRAGEFVASDVEKAMDTDALVLAACKSIIEQTQARKSVLIFASGISHAEHIVQAMSMRHHVECGFVCGETLGTDREKTLKRFATGDLKYLCNVNVLTTGFDAPGIDCIALLRPTMSPGLYYQMVGRGFRIAPGKEDCLVLDFGGNILRHGPVDDLQIKKTLGKGTGEAPAKECPDCAALIATGFRLCPYCGHEFPPPNRNKHDADASNESILSGEVSFTDIDVLATIYNVHTKRGAPESAPKTLRVDYQYGSVGYQSEWICLEHGGYAGEKAKAWWRRRSNAPIPSSSALAAELAYEGALAETKKIRVKRVSGEKFDTVVGYVLGEVPPFDCEKSEAWLKNKYGDEIESSETPVGQAYDDGDIPF